MLHATMFKAATPSREVATPPPSQSARTTPPHGSPGIAPNSELHAHAPTHQSSALHMAGQIDAEPAADPFKELSAILGRPLPPCTTRPGASPIVRPYSSHAPHSDASMQTGSTELPPSANQGEKPASGAMGAYQPPVTADTAGRPIGAMLLYGARGGASPSRSPARDPPVQPSFLYLAGQKRARAEGANITPGDPIGNTLKHSRCPHDLPRGSCTQCEHPLALGQHGRDPRHYGRTDYGRTHTFAPPGITGAECARTYTPALTKSAGATAASILGMAQLLHAPSVQSSAGPPAPPARPPPALMQRDAGSQHCGLGLLEQAIKITSAGDAKPLLPRLDLPSSTPTSAAKPKHRRVPTAPTVTAASAIRSPPHTATPTAAPMKRSPVLSAAGVYSTAGHPLFLGHPLAQTLMTSSSSATASTYSLTTAASPSRPPRAPPVHPQNAGQTRNDDATGDAQASVAPASATVASVKAASPRTATSTYAPKSSMEKAMLPASQLAGLDNSSTSFAQTLELASHTSGRRASPAVSKWMLPPPPVSMKTTGSAPQPPQKGPMDHPSAPHGAGATGESRAGMVSGHRRRKTSSPSLTPEASTRAHYSKSPLMGLQMPPAIDASGTSALELLNPSQKTGPRRLPASNTKMQFSPSRKPAATDRPRSGSFEDAPQSLVLLSGRQAPPASSSSSAAAAAAVVLSLSAPKPARQSSPTEPAAGRGAEPSGASSSSMTDAPAFVPLIVEGQLPPTGPPKASGSFPVAAESRTQTCPFMAVVKSEPPTEAVSGGEKPPSMPQDTGRYVSLILGSRQAEPTTAKAAVPATASAPPGATTILLEVKTTTTAAAATSLSDPPEPPTHRANNALKHASLAPKKTAAVKRKETSDAKDPNFLSKHTRCPHGRPRARCKNCGGSEICQHARRRRDCRECGGPGICEHGRRRRECKACQGIDVCVHRRKKDRCDDCWRLAVCEHGIQRAGCLTCEGLKPGAQTRRSGTTNGSSSSSSSGGQAAEAPVVPEAPPTSTQSADGAVKVEQPGPASVHDGVPGEREASRTSEAGEDGRQRAADADTFANVHSAHSAPHATDVINSAATTTSTHASTEPSLVKAEDKEGERDAQSAVASEQPRPQTQVKESPRAQQVCMHGLTDCRDCAGATRICEHGGVRSRCRICVSAAQMCEHHQRRGECHTCLNGDNNKARVRDLPIKKGTTSSSKVCAHGVKRRQCKDCGRGGGDGVGKKGAFVKKAMKVHVAVGKDGGGKPIGKGKGSKARVKGGPKDQGKEDQKVPAGTCGVSPLQPKPQPNKAGGQQKKPVKDNAAKDMTPSSSKRGATTTKNKTTGKKICQHHRQPYYCKDCGGAGICEHDRRRSDCKECGGNRICDHGRRRIECKECRAVQGCEHGLQRDKCDMCVEGSVEEDDTHMPAQREEGDEVRMEVEVGRRRAGLVRLRRGIWQQQDHVVSDEDDDVDDGYDDDDEHEDHCSATEEEEEEEHDDDADYMSDHDDVLEGSQLLMALMR